jgi:3-hydroxyacyl-CoA dehydrogenase
MTEQIEHIAVIGAGYMGGGIAQVFAMAGLDVVICDADPDLTRRHLDRLRGEAEDFESKVSSPPVQLILYGRICGLQRPSQTRSTEQI